MILKRDGISPWLDCMPHAPARPKETPQVDDAPDASLQEVFALLRARTGNDFSCYKRGTIQRRIERRLRVREFDCVARYVEYLHENIQEVELLHKELLIGVTNFFRDPGLFAFLKAKTIPQLLANRSATNAVRVWTPGCSTGEEAYSLAIVLKECLDALKPEEAPPVQIFATDIDQEAINKARQGTFCADIASHVSCERLQRFFVRDGAGYRIRKEVRDLMVFAPQNLLVDPPFTKLDILCCRNLLIYINGETQKKLLPLLHYALNPGGFLVLGSAESIGDCRHLFSISDKTWKVFQRSEAPK